MQFHEITEGLGFVKIYADCGARMVGVKGVTLCAFLGEQSTKTAYARDNAPHGAPQWGQSISLPVEEVTDTIQIILYRGDLRKEVQNGLKLQRTRLDPKRCIGQVLIPLAHLYPLRRGTKTLRAGAMDRIKVRSKSDSRLTVEAEGPGEEGGAAAGGAAPLDGVERGSVSLDDAQPSRSKFGRRGRHGRSKPQDEERAEREARRRAGQIAADSGLAAGGIASTEMEKWKHVFPTSEYQKEKQQTKEKRTRSLAANKNDDLFRNMVGQRQQRPEEDDDVRSVAMSVKSAPGGLGMRRRAGWGGSSRSGATDEEDHDSLVSMPVSVPSSGPPGRGAMRSSDSQAGSADGRAVHFATTTDGAESEASFASSAASDEGVAGPRSASPSGSEQAKDDDSLQAARSDNAPPAAQKDLSAGTSLLPEVPQAVRDPASKGQGTWYEIYPYCKTNADGRFRTAVDELEGLAMMRPGKRTDLPGELRTLGYVRLKVELSLDRNPYVSYLREPPKVDVSNQDENELSIPRLKANWLRVKMILMPNQLMRRARDIASWESIPMSVGLNACSLEVSYLVTQLKAHVRAGVGAWVLGVSLAAGAVLAVPDLDPAGDLRRSNHGPPLRSVAGGDRAVGGHGR